MTGQMPAERRMTMNETEKTFPDSKVEIHKRVSAGKITGPGVISRWAFLK